MKLKRALEVQCNGLASTCSKLQVRLAGISRMLGVRSKGNITGLFILIDKREGVASASFHISGRREAGSECYTMVRVNTFAGASLLSVNLRNGFAFGETEFCFCWRHILMQMVHDEDRSNNDNQYGKKRTDKKANII